MSVSDVPDWTRPIVIITGSLALSDFPDWTEAIQIATAGGAAYASLTGPGVSTTPGDLTQAGGLTVNASSGHNAVLNATNGAAVMESPDASVTVNDANPQGSIALVSSNRIYIQENSGNGILFECTVAGSGFQFYGHGNALVIEGGTFIAFGDFSTPGVTPGTNGSLYRDAGALKYKGGSGTITTIAPA